MVDTEDAPNELIPHRVGDRLRAARIAAKLDLADVATRTRIPLRHLTAIEAGNYAVLPAAMYCVGFVKAYARTVGEDEVEVARMLREEMGTPTVLERSEYYDAESDDPERLPSRKLAWTALALAVLIFGGFALWRYSAMAPSGDATEQTEEAADAGDGAAGNATAGTAPAAPANPAGQVVLTAKDAVWLSVKDASGVSLIFREMKPGESFNVPQDAASPRILTGRPENLVVTIDGKEVAPLGPPEKTVKDLEITAKALLARSPAPAAPPAAAGAVPAPSTGTAPAARP